MALDPNSSWRIITNFFPSLRNTTLEENAGISICRRNFSQGSYSNIIFPLKSKGINNQDKKEEKNYGDWFLHINCTIFCKKNFSRHPIDHQSNWCDVERMSLKDKSIARLEDARKLSLRKCQPEDSCIHVQKMVFF